MADIGEESPGFKLFGTVIVADDNRLNKKSPTPPPRSPVAAAELPCPRCKSQETKFCYFNNYNVNQPRHFCKACHRYWTAGGALRNVPVGAGRRRSRFYPRAGGVTAAEGGGGVVNFGADVERWLFRPEQMPAAGRTLSNAAGESC